MKNSIIILLALLFCSTITLTAQDDGSDCRWRIFKKKEKNKEQEIKTVFKNRGGVGFYWGMNSHYSRIAGEDALVIGSTMSFIANRSLEIGISGQGILSRNPNVGVYDNNVVVAGGYGGLHISPVFFSNKAVHFTLPILIGAGAAGYYDYKAFEEWDVEDYDWDGMFVIEPGVNVEFNISRVLRLGLGVKYRLTNKLDIANMDENDFRGWSAGMVFKLGKF